MEGLEVSEIKLKKLEYSKRLDAEYYRSKFLHYEKLIKESNNTELKQLANFLIGPFGSAFKVDNYTAKTTHRYIRGKDVKPLLLKNDDNVYMPEEDYNRLSKYALREKDILVSVVGTLGNAALVSKSELPAIFSCKSTVLRPHSINPVYLLVYINTKYGKELLLRKERGAIQKGLNLDDLKTIPIFIPDDTLQIKIEELYNTSIRNLNNSQTLYTQAENLLLDSLGLKDFEPSNKGTNIKTLKSSFLQSGRLDAEYYQPKYDDYISLVENYSNGSENIIDACTLKDKNYKPIEDKEYKYIELSNIGKTGEITGSTNDLGENLPSRARRIVKTGDIIISSIEGSLQSCAIITEKYNNSICSTGFYVLRSEKINSETLLVLFKSELMQNLLKQNCSGTILTAINKEDFIKIPIPIIDYNIQKEISTLIENSFALKQQSEQLLETAKHSVEIAIEQNEEAAIKYINS